ncbi:MAG TPA: HAD family acid phosphatase [Lacunisphaera sp.]|nr:HAD family acid phosphatase [Lacunisphaera sp.]
MAMLKRCPALFVLCAFLALPLSYRADPPANLDLAKDAVERYIASGLYGREVTKVAVSANKYLAKRLAKPVKEGEKRAIIFDIDETAVTNLSHITAQDFGYIPAVWKRWVAEGQARAIVPVQQVYDLAVRNNVAVFFITGRKASDAAATEKNLREVGYSTWTKIYYAADDFQGSARLFKTGARRAILNEGYTIVANIGDQQSDLVGGMAERTFKLPNPFYLIK